MLWPRLVADHGFEIFWAACAGVALQFFLNLEIERGTLAVGEIAVTGLLRLGRAWGPVFLVCTTVPWVGPGWATGAAEIVTWQLGALALLCLISQALLPPSGRVSRDFAFLADQAAALEQRFGPAARHAFLAACVAIRLSTELALLDAVSRVSADLLATEALCRGTRWNVSRVLRLLQPADARGPAPPAAGRRVSADAALGSTAPSGACSSLRRLHQMPPQL